VPDASKAHNGGHLFNDKDKNWTKSNIATNTNVTQSIHLYAEVTKQHQ